ncbi:MAG: hypothetical protein ABFS46_03270 [Myxococcota bacterium]
MSELPTSRRVSALSLVERLGGHPCTRAGIDPSGGDSERGRWWVLACLLSSRRDAVRAERAFAALRRAGLDRPDALASASPEGVAACLASAELREPAPLAARLCRSARTLQEAHQGSLDALARGCDELEELGARLSALGPGIGAGTLARFLRPLRDPWPAAGEMPLLPAARAAAVHLGWLTASEDEQGEPGALRAFLQTDPAPLADVEAALERLGATACLRERPERCPLAADCPMRG